MVAAENPAPGRFVLPAPYTGTDPVRMQASRALQATDDATVVRLHRRALWLRRMGDVQGAGHLMTALLTMRPHEPAFWTAMGECCAAAHDHDRALQALAHAIRLRSETSPGPAAVALVSSLLALGLDGMARMAAITLQAQAEACADLPTSRRLESLSQLLEQRDAT